jgi:hypothetical protein
MSYIQYPAIQAQLDAGVLQHDIDRQVAFNSVIGQVQKLAKLGIFVFDMPSPAFFLRWQLEELFVAQGYLVTKVGEPPTRITISWGVVTPAENPLAPVAAFESEIIGDPQDLDFTWPAGVKFLDTSEGSPTSWFWQISTLAGAELFTSRQQNPIFTLNEDVYRVQLTVTNIGGNDSVSSDVTIGA